MKRKELVWIEQRDVVAIHDQLLASYGGRPGLRDEGLLQSALARPRQHHAYAQHSDVIAMAALYTAGIVRNHPFVDGNKRTSLLALYTFLGVNGIDFVVAEADAAAMILALAAGEVSEESLARWIRDSWPSE